MERQKSMETSLLRKSLSIRERRVPNDDGYLETGFTPKGHPNNKDFNKHQIEDGESSVTVSVCIITFIVVTGSFCVGCGVSTLNFHVFPFKIGFIILLTVIYYYNCELTTRRLSTD